MELEESKYFYLDSDYCINKLDKNLKIIRYDGMINYNSGMTNHYKENRMLRERELTRVLGEGKRLKAFIVIRENKETEIQEVRDNAIIVVYSFETHKKITLFAPSPNRLENLYHAIGEVPDDNIIGKSEENTLKGYNGIYNYC